MKNLLCHLHVKSFSGADARSLVLWADVILCFAPDKVLVHCVMGRSRSATLVLAYLMMKQSLTVVDAIEHVKQHRCILPNHGFLKQLRALDIDLREKKLRLKREI